VQYNISSIMNKF